MDNNDERVYKAHNNMFVKAFSDHENVRVFLNMVLPESLREAIDLTQIHLEFTTCISDKLKDAFSDMVIKTVLKTSASTPLETDIYFLMEHKSYEDDKTLIQVLKYMYLEWQKDSDHGRPLRVIIPLIFYHGERDWRVPRSFVENFKVSDTLKPFLLNFRYVFFDTKDWDFRAAANQDLKNNVFLLTTLILMQNAFNDNQEIMSEIFKLWHQKGFTDFKEKVIACMVYMTEIRDLSLVQLKKTLEENKIDGGEIMQSLAQVLRDEGKEIWMAEGKKENAKEVAMDMLNDNFPIETIIKYTHLTEKEIRALMS